MCDAITWCAALLRRSFTSAMFTAKGAIRFMSFCSYYALLISYKFAVLRFEMTSFASPKFFSVNC